MASHKKYNLYKCRDCEVEYMVSRISRKRSFCPSCGENVFTEKTKSIWMPRPVLYKRPWSEEEDDIIRTGKSLGYKVSKIVESLEERTGSAVRCRWERIKDKGVEI